MAALPSIGNVNSLLLSVQCLVMHKQQEHAIRNSDKLMSCFFCFASLRKCYPEGCAAPGSVPCKCNTRGLLSKLEETPPQTKINVTSKSPVGDISVVTLIRTDTTLDHSQKAEKEWTNCCESVKPIKLQTICAAFVKDHDCRDATRNGGLRDGQGSSAKTALPSSMVNLKK